MAAKKTVPLPKITNLESFSCIWLDQDIHVTQDNQETLHQLRSIINHLQIFDDAKMCEQCIRMISKEKVILLVSGRLGRIIIPSIHNLPQFLASYIFCQDVEGNKGWASKYAKVKGVFNVRADLVAALASDQKGLAKMADGGCISILNRGSGSIQERNAVFMWFQLFVEALLRMHQKTSDRKELIDLCKKTYNGNDQEMGIILEFEKKYKSEDAIWWYTRESCFFRLMNKALRVQDYDTLLALRFLITDIAKQIKFEHEKFIRNHPSRDSIHVYRGQLISHDELELMKKSIGEYLSMNSFLSTSYDRKIALGFARKNSTEENTAAILFEIEINLRLQTKAFADVTTLSYFQEEGEVLLMLGSLFRIENILEDKKERVWIAKLSLASEADFELKETFAHMKEKIGDDTNLDSLGKILLEMGAYQQAKKYYARMVAESQLTLSDAQSGLGMSHMRCEELDESLKQHKKALQLRQEIVGNEDGKVAESYCFIGMAYWSGDNYEKALESLKKSEDIQEKMSSPDLAFLARTYNAIAVTYDASNNYRLALEYYNKALEIRKTILPPTHPDIALVYNNLGTLAKDHDDKKAALEYYQKSLEISKKSLPPDHPDLVRTMNNISKLEHKLTK